VTPLYYTGSTYELRRATMVFTRLGEDVANCGISFLNITSGAPDATWTSADYTTVEGYLTTFWNAIKGNFRAPFSGGQDVSLGSIVWHKQGPGIGRPNPAERTTAVNSPATGTGLFLPAQVACAVTLKTSYRRNWGRFYLPNPVSSTLDGLGGQYTSAFVTTVRDAAGALLDSCKTNDFPMMVFSARNAGGLLDTVAGHTETPDDTSHARSVDTVQVDSIIDIIRSRRDDVALVKLSHTLP
jgi:hypothetical protein